MAREVEAEGPHGEHPTGFAGLMRNRNYALLWSGQLVSEMGNRFHWLAVSLWIYSLTQSAASVSLAISAMFVGGLAVSLWAGALIDRLNRKWVLISADLCRAILVSLIPTLIDINLWLVYIDLALVSVATAFFRPAIFALVPRIVARKDLLSANSFFSAMDTGTEIIGPAIAGILALRYGYSLLLYVDSLTYVFSAVLILMMHGTFVPRKPSADTPFPGLWRGIVEGLNYIRRDHLQWALFVLIFPAYLVGSGLNALQTPLAKGEIGISDAQFGTFNSVWGAGFLVASLLLGWYGSIVSKGGLVLGGFLLQFSFTALMGMSTNVSTLYATAFLVGFSNTMSYVGLSTVLMEHTPSEIMGRVVSTRQVALHLVRVVSPLVFGASAELLGIRQAILLMTLTGAVGTLIVSGFLHPFDTGGRERHIADGGPWRRIAPVDMTYDVPQQVRLNVAALVALAICWIIVAVRDFSGAVWLLVSLVSLAYLGFLGRRRKWLP